ncbi:hypothetical protein X975_00185, partial [Stegodyphus mimosarum]
MEKLDCLDFKSAALRRHLTAGCEDRDEYQAEKEIVASTVVLDLMTCALFFPSTGWVILVDLCCALYYASEIKLTIDSSAFPTLIVKF